VDSMRQSVQTEGYSELDESVCAAIRLEWVPRPSLYHPKSRVGLMTQSGNMKARVDYMAQG
jgi:hypothetical protein